MARYVNHLRKLAGVTERVTAPEVLDAAVVEKAVGQQILAEATGDETAQRAQHRDERHEALCAAALAVSAKKSWTRT